MAPRLRYGWLEIAIAGSCISLAILGAAFSQTEGLVAGESTERHVRDYNSTGSDDDLCIVASVVIFGLCLLLVGWLPSLGQFDYLKTIAFTVGWLVQLLLIEWIEVGSIVQTLRVDVNIVLLLWLVVFVLSPIFVWGITIWQIAKQVGVASDRRIAI